jgi:hypothetical protein
VALTSSSRTHSVIGLPLRVATGRSIAMPPCWRRAFASQPAQARVSPRRRNRPVPASLALRGSLIAVSPAAGFASMIQLNRNLRPRFGTSNSSVPLPRAGSFGRSRNRSVAYSTIPRALRGASAMSAMPALAGSAGSSSPRAVATTRS